MALALLNFHSRDLQLVFVSCEPRTVLILTVSMEMDIS